MFLVMDHLPTYFCWLVLIKGIREILHKQIFRICELEIWNSLNPMKGRKCHNRKWMNAFDVFLQPRDLNKNHSSQICNTQKVAIDFP